MDADKVTEGREGAIDVCLVDRVVEEETGREGLHSCRGQKSGPARHQGRDGAGTKRGGDSPGAGLPQKAEETGSFLAPAPANFEGKEDQTTAGGADELGVGAFLRPPGVERSSLHELESVTASQVSVRAQLMHSRSSFSAGSGICA